jgi:hypothetical protein
MNLSLIAKGFRGIVPAIRVSHCCVPPFDQLRLESNSAGRRETKVVVPPSIKMDVIHPRFVSGINLIALRTGPEFPISLPKLCPTGHHSTLQDGAS